MQILDITWCGLMVWTLYTTWYSDMVQHHITSIQGHANDKTFLGKWWNYSTHLCSPSPGGSFL